MELKSDQSQAPANSTENDRSISEFDGWEVDNTMSTLDETDVDNDVYDEFGVISHIIDEGADLSRWHARSPPKTFEEESLPRWDGQSAEDDTYLEVESMSMPNTPSSHTSRPLLHTCHRRQIQDKSSEWIPPMKRWLSITPRFRRMDQMAFAMRHSQKSKSPRVTGSLFQLEFCVGSALLADNCIGPSTNLGN